MRTAILALALAGTSAGCVQSASRPLTLDAAGARDAPPAVLVRTLNQANAQKKHRDGYFSNIPCKGFTETHARIRNWSTSSVKDVPYSALTFTLRSDGDAIAAQLVQEGHIAMDCTILVFPPSNSRDLSPAQSEALKRVGTALYGLGARLAPGITAR